MEEIHSTEKLEAEILDEARKKAAAVLANADKQIAENSAAWQKKMTDALDAEKKRLDAKLAAEKIEAEQSVALDKMRVRLRRTGEELSAAARDFFAALPRNETLNILQTRLSKQIAETAAIFLEDGSASGGFNGARVLYKNLQEDEARSVLAAAAKKSGGVFAAAIAASPLKSLPFGEIDEDGPLPVLILLADSVRITSSLNAACEDFLLEKRAEAAATMANSVPDAPAAAVEKTATGG